MNVIVHARNTITKNGAKTPDNRTTGEQKVIIVERLEKALKHVAHQVRDVEVYLEDQTPASGKFDGRCRITVHFDKGNPVNVEGHGENFAETLADGVKKVHHAVEHIRERKMDKKRRVASVSDVSNVSDVAGVND